MKTMTITMSMCFLFVGLCVWPAMMSQAAQDPIWGIIKQDTGYSVPWFDYAPNPRFAIYRAGTPDYPSDDIVLDKETGLIWHRDAFSFPWTTNWYEAMQYCRNTSFAHRRGWRLPTAEELATLVDTSQRDPALPVRHPFLNIPTEGSYWSSTTYHEISDEALGMAITDGVINPIPKNFDRYIWCVRGGNGYATGNW